MNSILKNFNGKVSVIVTVYNIAEYLEDCVQSICAQSYQNLEIILVDDGSTDESPALCDRLSAADARVRVLHQPNGGVSVARNSGVAAVTGDYIVFVDGDDYLPPLSVEQLLVTALRENCDLAACCYATTAECLEQTVLEDTCSLSAEEALKDLFAEKRFFPSPWGKIYRKEVFDGVVFPEGLIYEDYAIMGQLFRNAGRVAFTPARAYFYRYTPTGITKSTFKQKHMDYFTVTDMVEKFVQEAYPNLMDDFENYTVRNSIGFYKKMSAAGHTDQTNIDTVRRYAKRGFGHYLKSGYPLSTKLYGLAILVAPRLALKVFLR